MSTPAIRRLAWLGIAALAGCATSVPSDGYRANRPMAPQALGDQHVRPNARGVVAPRRISGSAPVYPVTSLLRGTTGEALIEFTITETGETGNFTVVEASSPSTRSPRCRPGASSRRARTGSRSPSALGSRWPTGSVDAGAGARAHVLRMLARRTRNPA